MTAAARPVLCLLGPTGIGKTDLAVRLAGEYPLEIISVDSAMVYRHMDIGTAKPDATVRAHTPHHLIDIRDPWETYSAGEFRTDALHLISAIHGRGRVPLLVGGTMLYFRALFRGLAPLPPADAGVREGIDREARERGWRALHEDLQRIDPAAALRISPLDRQRIQRAVEVFRLTGQPISTLQQHSHVTKELRFVRLALLPPAREELYRQLDRRLSQMIGSGFVAEVEQIMAFPLMSADRPAMRAVGYRQLCRHVSGAISLKDAGREAAVATRRLAKRQLTWLRSEVLDLELDAAAADTPQRVARAIEEIGVSRLAHRCNMIDPPLECREHGV